MERLLAIAALVIVAVAAHAQSPDDPNPFATYGKGMASDKDHPMAVEWQNAYRADIAVATAEDALVDLVANEETARSLLAKVGSAYDGDPLALTQIAAVSQWVMSEEPCMLLFWRPSPAAGRRIWTAALIRAAKTSQCDYLRLVCMEQLRWCGFPEQAVALRTLSRTASTRAVRAVAQWVAAELEARK